MRSRPDAVVRKLFVRARARGWPEVMQLGIERVRESIASDDELVFFSVDTATIVRIERDDLTSRAATREDAEAFAEEIGTDSRGTFVDRLRAGTRCYLVLAGEHIVHSSWVTTEAAWTRELRGYVRPPAGAAYVYESFTAEDARGKGIYPFALSNICADLSADDISHLWVAVEADNPSSLRAVTKAGFTERVRVAYKRRFWKLSVEPLRADDDLPRIVSKLT